MINIEKGRYWDEGITLVDGCSPCSPGCDHCWSAAMAHRFDKEGEPGHENHILTLNESPVFNGIIQTYPERLKHFNTRKPKVFAIWNDLFHNDVDLVFRERVYADAFIYHNNTYLFLTKRPQNINKEWHIAWPVSNIYHGLTVCNQQEADEKIPIFLQVPGKKFLSIEPMLGPVIIRKYIEDDCDCGICKLCNGQIKDRRLIDAVILGGESGPKARPLHPDWVRSVRDQCAAAGVPFFFKQWGSSGVMGSAFKGNEWHDAGYDFKIKQTHGRLLDGRTHDELPWVKP